MLLGIRARFGWTGVATGRGLSSPDAVTVAGMVRPESWTRRAALPSPVHGTPRRADLLAPAHDARERALDLR